MAGTPSAAWDLRRYSDRWFRKTRAGYVIMVVGAVLLTFIEAYILVLAIAERWPLTRSSVALALPIPFILMLYLRARTLGRPLDEIRINDEGVVLVARSGTTQTLAWNDRRFRLRIFESVQDLWSDSSPTTRFRISRLSLPDIPIPQEVYEALAAEAARRGLKVYSHPPAGFTPEGTPAAPRNCVHYVRSAAG